MYKYQIWLIDGPLKGKRRWVAELENSVSPLTGVTYWLMDKGTHDVYRYTVKRPKAIK